MKNISQLMALSLLTTASAQAAQWEYHFTGPQPKVEIAPLKYDKSWAYAVEIDDGPVSTLQVSLPLLAKYQWNDAPPGVKGGKDRPFAGTAAVSFSGFDTGNSTLLNQKQSDELRAAGWDIVNHSYWHTGNHWDKTKFLKPEDFRRELFWSQLFYAETTGKGRGATHFVYPNGDPYYQPFLKDYGLRSSSRVGGSSPRNLFDAKWNPLDLDRNYLDEGVWAGKNDVLFGFPKTPQNGDFIIDFTHGMKADPESKNHVDWLERLDHIAGTYGAQGDNSVWVAPTDAIVNYRLAAQVAKVSVAPGLITVTLPDDAPASALTLKLSGLSHKTQLPTQDAATPTRQGDVAWITTPVIGKMGAELPQPKLKKIYDGPIKDLSWDEPVQVAGVRLRQSGPVAKDYSFKMDAETPDGKTVSIVPDNAKIADAWGRWLLFPTIPDRDAVSARALKVAPDPNLRQMEVWALAP